MRQDWDTGKIFRISDIAKTRVLRHIIVIPCHTECLLHIMFLGVSSRYINNQMAVLCWMPTLQYSAQSSRLSVHKLFTSYIRRTLVLRDSIVSIQWWLAAYDWVSVISHVVNPHQTSQKIWGGFLYGVYIPGDWLWIDSNGKNGN